jgi:hypothetical protein
MPVNLGMKTVSNQEGAGQHKPPARRGGSPQDGARALAQELPGATHLLTAAQVLARVRRLRLRTPRESVRMIRADRNAR